MLLVIKSKCICDFVLKDTAHEKYLFDCTKLINTCIYVSEHKYKNTSCFHFFTICFVFFFLVASFHKLLGEIGQGDRRFGRQKISGMFVGGICLWIVSLGLNILNKTIVLNILVINSWWFFLVIFLNILVKFSCSQFLLRILVKQSC